MNALDNPPFDVTAIQPEDDPLQALIKTRGRTPLPAARFRPLAQGDSDRAGETQEHHPEVAAEAGPTSAPQAGTVEGILIERQKTHGDFSDNARITQSLKRIAHAEVGWDKLTDVQRESVHMILLKLGRILSGNQNTKDHWDDIAGYAKLVSERIT